jgi:hypothetical protein
MIENTWITVRKQSLSIAARNAGFDLAVYDLYSQGVQFELRKRAIKAIIREIRLAFEDETGEDPGELTQGVYVISVAKPLTISYPNKRSDVIYIGIGNVMNRIEQHFNNSLFDFMQSLSGADFDFRFSKPWKRNSPDYYKHVEYEMLEYFFGTAGRFPLLNTNAGSNRGIQTADEWWAAPLKSTGRTPRWALEALPGSGFETLD